jgi:hypothetical protein
MNLIKRLSIAAIVVSMTACSTTGHFVVPQGSKLYLGGRPEPVKVENDGTVTTHAFGWESMGVAPEGGIQYRLEENGKTTQEGKLRVVLRVAAFFIPIFGIITVPAGLNPDITYDLVKGTQE